MISLVRLPLREEDESSLEGPAVMPHRRSRRYCCPSLDLLLAVRIREHLGILPVPGEHTAQNVREDIHPAIVADANLLLLFSF